MDDRRVVHAVELLAVNLIRVEHRRVHERQAFAAAEYRRLLRAAGASEHVEDLAAPRRLAAGDPDGQRISDEGLGRGSGGLGHPVFGHPFDMRDNLVDDRILQHAALTRLLRSAPSPAVRERECNDAASSKLLSRIAGEGGPSPEGLVGEG